jgi:hypothetical protein
MNPITAENRNGKPEDVFHTWGVIASQRLSTGTGTSMAIKSGTSANAGLAKSITPNDILSIFSGPWMIWKT